MEQLFCGMDQFKLCNMADTSDACHTLIALKQKYLKYLRNTYTYMKLFNKLLRALYVSDEAVDTG